jgi:hypothetical protein
MKHKVKLLIKIIHLSIINIYYLIFFEKANLFKRYKKDGFTRKVKLIYYEEASPWIAFTKVGIQKFIYIDFMLKNQKEAKLWRRRIELTILFFLLMTMIYFWWICIKYFLKILYNIISLILYFILPRKYSKKFDMFVLTMVRGVYMVLYRLEWLINQVLYITFILIPFFVLGILLECTLLFFELLVYILRNPIDWIPLGLSYIYFPLKRLYQFFSARITKYIVMRILNVDEKRKRRKELINKLKRKVKTSFIMTLALLKKGLKKIFKEWPQYFIKWVINLLFMFIKLVFVNIIWKSIRFITGPFEVIIAKFLLKNFKYIEFLYLLFFEYIIVKPIQWYLIIIRRLYIVEIELYKILAIACKPLVKRFELFLANGRSQMILYRKFLWILCDIVIKIELKYFKEKSESIVYTYIKDDKKYMYNQVKNNVKGITGKEVCHTLLKYKYKDNILIDYLLWFKNPVVTKWDSTIASLLIYMSKDMEGLKTIEKPKTFIDLLRIKLGFFSLKKSKANNSVFDNNNITNYWGNQDLSHKVIEPAYGVLFKKDTNMGRELRRFLKTVKTFIVKKWYYGNWDDEEDMFGATPELSVPESWRLKKKAEDERNNNYWTQFVMPLKERTKSKEDGVTKIQKLFYLKMLENQLMEDLNQGLWKKFAIKQRKLLKGPYDESLTWTDASWLTSYKFMKKTLNKDHLKEINKKEVIFEEGADVEGTEKNKTPEHSEQVKEVLENRKEQFWKEESQRSAFTFQSERWRKRKEEERAKREAQIEGLLEKISKSDEEKNKNAKEDPYIKKEAIYSKKLEDSLYMKQKEKFTSYLLNKSKEAILNYTLGYNRKSMSFYGNNEGILGNHLFLKNKPFVNLISNNTDSYLTNWVRSWKISFLNFMNKDTNIDYLKKEERIRAYRLQQEWGRDEDELFLNKEEDYNKSKLEEADQKLEKITVNKSLYDMYRYWEDDFWWDVYRWLFRDDKIRDANLSYKFLGSFYLSKIIFSKRKNMLKRISSFWETINLISHWYVNYLYLFHNTRNNHKGYKQTAYIFEDYLNDIIGVIKDEAKKRDKKEKEKKLSCLEKFLLILFKIIIWPFRIVLKLWAKIVFFLHYYYLG